MSCLQLKEEPDQTTAFKPSDFKGSDLESKPEQARTLGLTVDGHLTPCPFRLYTAPAARYFFFAVTDQNVRPRCLDVRPERSFHE